MSSATDVGPKAQPESGAPPAPCAPADPAEARRRLLALAMQRKREAASALPGRVGDPLAREAPATQAQAALHFIDELDGPSGLYNVVQALHLRGHLDDVALERSLQWLVERQDALRTGFERRDGGLVQRVTPDLALRLAREDLSEGAAEGTALKERLLAAASAPFDLSSAPLLRAHLFRLGPQHHVLLLAVHHIVSDGWSMSVLARDLGVAYAAFREGRPPSAAPLRLRFLDHARQEHESLQGERLAELLSGWRQRLAGLTPLALPTDRPRRADTGVRGDVHRFALTPGLSTALRGLAQAEGATLFMVLLAGFQVLLQRHAGQDDIVVGSPVAGRGDPELEHLVGYFVNSLVLRTDLSGAPTFLELIGRVRETALAAYAGAELPFDRLVADLQPVRDFGANPLYQVSFALNNQPPTVLSLAGLEVEPLAVQTDTAKFDLALAFAERGGRLEGAIEFNTGLFDASTVRRMAEQLNVLLHAAVADPARPIDTLPWLSATARQAALEAAEGPRQAVPEAECLHHAFEAVARSHPQAVAARAEGRELSYGELERRSRSLANRLADRGIGPDDRVALALPRGFDLLVAVMAVLRAGAAYVPLDLRHPDERLAFMMRDAGVRAVLCPSADAPRLAPLAAGSPADDPTALLRVDGLADEAADPRPGPTPAVQPEHLAYVIYTSGSTGVPKGVALTHRGICNHVRWMVGALGIGPSDVFLQKTSISFDASLVEIFVPLSVGATTVLVEGDGERDTQLLVRTVRDERVTVLQAVPSALAALLEEPELPQCASLRRLISGGESLDRELARSVRARLPQVALGNFYGPTEATIDATWHEVEAVAPGAGTVPIGRAVANARCHVLDRRRQPLPDGVPGELYIGGRGLARGYLGRPELDAERFVADPFIAGERLYRTGDLARRLPDGNIECLGRLDDQVKLRGFRIELGEIEAAIQSLTGGRPCAVLLREDRRGSPEIVAYIEGGREEADTLTQALATRLPEPMKPAVLMPLARLPRLASGKIDRKALPAPEARGSDAGGAVPVAPSTPTEALLLDLWRDALGVESLGVQDHFFQRGGHSLLAAQVAARARRALGRELPLRWIFEHPTVAAIAARVDGLSAAADGLGGPEAEPAAALDVGPQPGDRPDTPQGLPVSFAQRRMWLLQQLDPQGSAYHMAVAERLRGPLDLPALQAAWQDVCDAHEALRTEFAMGDDEPVQRVAARRAASIEILEPPVGSADEPDRHARDALRPRVRAPLDLAQAPLHRIVLLRESSEAHVLMIVLHHAIGDDWSLGLLMRDLAAAYRARRGGAPTSVLAPPRVGYADFAAWERRRFGEPALPQRLLSAWRERLAGVQGLALPTDHRPPARRTGQGGRLHRSLSLGTVGAIRSLAAAQGATPFMVLLAAFSLLLARRCGQDEVVLGTPVSVRPTVDCEQIVGVMLNTLVLRLPGGGEGSFSAHIGRVREAVVAAFALQDLPYELLVEGLRADQGPGAFPDLRVLFNVLGAPATQRDFEGLSAERLRLDPGTAQVDLALQIDLDRGGEVMLTYASDVFERDTAERWIEAFVALVAAALARPQGPAADLPVGHDHEWARLDTWNDTTVTGPAVSTVQALIALQAARTPQAVALAFEGQTLRFEEIEQQSNRLARALRGRGVRRGHLVGLCVERGPALLVGLLGVLKAGAAYVPLDPDYPPQRLRDMAEDARLSLLVSQSSLRGVLAWPRDQSLWIDADADVIAGASPDPLVPDPEADAGEDDPAYVIYTSGSTGKPKGVVVLHRGVVNFLASMAREPGLGPGDRLVAVTTLSFDIAVLELLGPLATGGTVLLASRMTALDGRALRALVEEGQATLMQATPSTWRLLVESGWHGRPGFRALIGGEPLPPDLARSLLDRCSALWNLYGPTETTVWSTARQVPPDVGDIDIGRPIGNTQVHVLDARRRRVPIGVAGEICIGGRGVAGGYLHREDLTRDRFIEHPLAGEPGGRLYRTGDLGRWRHDGTLEHLGRMDFQVKVRGHRIELGEIESQLLAHPAVGRCVVTTREDRPGDVRIVAYWVPVGEAPAAAELRTHLAGRLPAYMLPQHFVPLAELPLLPNGKVNRGGLPPPPDGGEGGSAAAARVEPEGEIEHTLSRIWCRLLKLERLSVEDSFFDLGGHSLMAARLVRAIETEMGRPCNLQMLYRAPSVRALAALLARSEMPDGAELVRLDDGHAPAKLFFICGVYLYQPLARELADRVSSFGVFLPYENVLLQGSGARRMDWPTTAGMAADYVKVIRTEQPHGPYRLAGVSFGGVLAFEIAQQLRAAGEAVEAVTLLDSLLRHSVGRHWGRWAWEWLRSGQRAAGRLTRRLLVRPRRAPQGLGEFPLTSVLDPHGGTGDMDEAEARVLAARDAIYLRAIRHYRPRPYDSPVLLARALDLPLRKGESTRPAYGWDRFIERLEVVDLPGDHIGILRPPSVKQLAQGMRRFLERAPRTGAEPPRGESSPAGGP